MDSFLCPWGIRKPLHFLYIQPTLDGHLLLAQSTDSHRKSTSLMWTLHYPLCALIDPSFLKGKKTLTAFRLPQCYRTSDKMICRRQFQTILASNKSHRDRFSLRKYRWLIFECFLAFTRWNNSFVKVKDAKFDDTNFLFYFFKILC